MKKILITGFFCFYVIIFSSCQEQNFVSMPGFDFALFKSTPAEELARAIEKEDTSKIKEIIAKDNTVINYQDLRFGTNLLSVAMINQKFISMNYLLAVGADPNIKSKIDGATTLTNFCEFNYLFNNSSDILKLLIRHGADVNTERIWQEKQWNNETKEFHETALQTLCHWGSIDLVKILVDNGARLDSYPINGESSLIYFAINNSKLDILEYLLIEKKVPVPDYVTIDKYTPEKSKVNLRQMIVTRGQHQVKDKQQQQIEDKILSFLQANGK